MANAFTLRKLELAQPLIEAAQASDPKALVKLAALALADEGTLKLYAAGSTDAMDVFVDQAYQMDSDEVATLLANFIAGSQKFSLLLRGLNPEEAKRNMSQEAMKLRAELGLSSLEELQPVLEALQPLKTSQQKKQSSSSEK